MKSSRFNRLTFAVGGALALCLPAGLLAQTILTAPQSLVATAGGTAIFNVTASGSLLTYQWQKDGVPLAGATGTSLTVSNVQPGNAGVYTAVVTSTATNTSVSASAILGLNSTVKVIGAGTEVLSNATIPTNTNVYDQVLLQGPAATITADPGQITRISYIDLADDIVQVEFSGAGALSLVLSNVSGPAVPVNYNQSTQYMKGHATIVIAGANDTTNVAVFSVGTATAVNQALFKPGVTYNGVADIADLAILSTNGKFGGIRTANTSYLAAQGLVGIYAPGVQFTGPVFLGDITASGSASPVLVLGSASDVRVTGGTLAQLNAQPVTVAGLTQLSFTDGTTSQGTLLPAQLIQGHLTQGGSDVTNKIVLSTVSVAATKATSDGSGSNPGEFTFTRAGGTGNAVTVNYAVAGSAINGYDFPVLPGSIVIPAGATSAKLSLLPNPSVANSGNKTAVVTLLSGTGYGLGSQNTGTVTILFTPATLYVATIRPEATAVNSTVSGIASLLLSSSGTLAGITVSFSNLSSAEVTAHLRISPSGDFVANLPSGQITTAQWTFSPTGTYSSADLLAALKSGNIYVGIDSSNYPSGEAKGTFVQGAGTQAFTAPAAPPPVALGNVTATDAARFLTQATFGPKRSEIDALTGQSIDAWLTAQLALPFTSHRTAVVADRTTFGGSGSFTNWNAITLSNRQAAWFKTVLTAPDQLRQRVAFALSELFVVSDVSLGDDSETEPLANYYDILGNGAFGSFRTLLENVTLSPMMGNYLSSLRNSKADPTTGQTPDENYAREVMQLFTIGLNMLQPDGTLQLGNDGLPIATYNQATVTEMAKVFTGWAYPSTNLNAFRTAGTNYFSPMQLFPAFHDNTAKNLNLSSLTVIPANTAADSGTTDLKLALDALANHQNTGPFIARHLIQRLVTSNPSPAYVYRVAQVFKDDGTGTRGNLGAVVRAILTDYEARSPAVATNITFGKLKEPLLRLTALMRSFNATASTGRYSGFQVTANGTPITSSTPIPSAASLIGTLSASTRFDGVQSNLDEAALRSPTVFNFFHSTYVLPGALAAAGLVAPEYEITDATYSIDTPNLLRNVIFAAATGTGGPYTVVPDFTAEQALVATPSALLDHLNLVLCGGNLPQAARDRVTSALAALPSSTSTLERAQTAVLLLATTAAGATQK